MQKLLSEYKIKDVTLKNRVVMPPMCMYKAKEDGKVTDFHLTHYGARAIGGVGLIITEATGVEARGRITDNDLGLWSDEQIQGHKAVVDLCHSFSSKIAVQLAHAGRKSICTQSTPIAPSALQFAKEGGFKLPHALHVKEIEELKDSFLSAAKRAKEAGYDVLEIHAAHGYLLFEFLSALTNIRDDNYGGSLENRCRLTLEICKSILEKVDLPLIVRISADEWVDDGWSIDDTVYLSKELKTIGVSMMHVSAGGNHAVQPNMPELKALYQASYAKEVSKQANIPTIAVGLITTAQEAEELLENGTCELVAYGRELLRNPNLVQFVAKEYGQRDFIDSSYLRAF